MSIPSFPNLTFSDQISELHAYLVEIGAQLPEEVPDAKEAVVAFINSCPDLLKKDLPEGDLESVLNTITSLLLQYEVCSKQLVLMFCEILQNSSGGPRASVCLRALWMLFLGLPTANQLRYNVYCAAVKLAASSDQLPLIFKDVLTLKQQLSECTETSEQLQKLLRMLHEALLAANETQLAAEVMLELLRTYTANNALQAKEDARRCILACLADPHTFLLDHLLSLKPVTLLKGEPIYDLLLIFVQEQLSSYLKFEQNHRELLAQMGLNSKQCLHKMRLLTLVSLTNQYSELAFCKVQEELQIESSEVEHFIIEAIQVGLLNGRMDQATGKLNVSSSTQRTFGRVQWQQLHDMLSMWRSNLHAVRQGLQQVAEMAVACQ